MICQYTRMAIFPRSKIREEIEAGRPQQVQGAATGRESHEARREAALLANQLGIYWNVLKVSLGVDSISYLVIIMRLEVFFSSLKSWLFCWGSWGSIASVTHFVGKDCRDRITYVDEPWRTWKWSPISGVASLPWTFFFNNQKHIAVQCPPPAIC